MKNQQLQKGIDCFNRQLFYEAHEAWEHLWLKERGDDRLFLQGLIQVAGGFHHVQKGRFKPAITCLKKGKAKLENYLPFHQGLDLRSLNKEVREWIEGFLNDNKDFLPRHDRSHHKSPPDRGFPVLKFVLPPV